MHITSLPGPHGSGDLSREAFDFIDFCADARQTLWQMLPVGPPGDPPWNSPYSSYSSSAGSPYLVSLHGLAEDGLLTPRDLKPPAGASDRKVKFRATRAFRDDRLRTAYGRFRNGKCRRALRAAFAAFANEQRPGSTTSRCSAH